MKRDETVEERTNKQANEYYITLFLHFHFNYWRAYIDGLNELCKGWDLNVFETCAFKGPWHFSFGYILI